MCHASKNRNYSTLLTDIRACSAVISAHVESVNNHRKGGPLQEHHWPDIILVLSHSQHSSDTDMVLLVGVYPKIQRGRLTRQECLRKCC